MPAALHHRCEVLQVDLVHDPRPRRHHAEVAEGVLRPAQQCVALPVALHLALDVPAVRRVRPEVVHLHGVVDDEVGGHHRVDALGVASHGRDPRPHGRQVHHGGHAREVLQHHPGGQEGHVGAGVGRAPRRHRAHVLLAHVAPAGVPERVLEQDADGEGKAVEGGDALFLKRSETVERGLALARVQGGERAEGVVRGCFHGSATWVVEPAHRRAGATDSRQPQTNIPPPDDAHQRVADDRTGIACRTSPDSAVRCYVDEPSLGRGPPCVNLVLPPRDR